MKMRKLSELTSLLSGFAFNASLFNDEKMGLPLIRVRDVNSGFAGFYYSGEYDQQFLINKGDILISLDGDFKAIEWKGDDALLNQRVCKIIPNADLLNREYLLHFLPEILKDIHRKTRFTTVKHLSTKTINNIEIPLPSLPDQRHIARLLSKAEQLIAQRQESLRLLDAYLKSTFLEMFGDPVRNPKNLPFTELQNLCSEIIDCPHSTPVKSKHETLYPCIRTSEIRNGYISWDSMQYLEEEEYLKRTQRLTPEAGDVVYGREGTFGDAVRIPETHRFSLGQRTMLFRPDYSKTNSAFLWAMVRSDFVYTQAKRKNSGSTVGHVNVKDIKQFKVYNPPLNLQTQFAQIVAQTELLKTQYQRSLVELEQLYGSLSQKAFRGELTYALEMSGK